MSEKMSRFTDAGQYAQDDDIDFLPDGHIYLYRGNRQLLPVSSLIAYFFEQFDAQATAERLFARDHIPVAESLTKWERTGRKASEVGTFVHEQTENWFQHGHFDTVYDFHFHGQVEHVSVEREREQFMHFITDYHIEPYRQEWPVFDLDLNIAGTIDMVCRNDDGTYTIYDWKRSSKIIDRQGNLIREGFRGKMSLTERGICVPDTAYSHYCIQQNLYRYMLQQHYGIRVRALNLVVLCPDLTTYHVVPIAPDDSLVGQIAAIARERNLGRALLH